MSPATELEHFNAPTAKTNHFDDDFLTPPSLPDAPFDQLIEEFTAAILHAADSLIVDLDQLQDKQQQYVIGIKDATTQLLTIYHKQRNNFKTITIASYLCALDLQKLLSYISRCCVRLSAAHFTPLSSDVHIQMVTKIYKQIRLLQATFDKWETDKAQLIEPMAKLVEQNFHALYDGECALTDSQAVSIINEVASTTMMLFGYVGVYCGAIPEFESATRADLIPKSYEVGIVSDFAFMLIYAITRLSDKALSHTMTPAQLTLLSQLSKNTDRFRMIWDDVMHQREVMVGIVPCVMPELSSTYD